MRRSPVFGVIASIGLLAGAAFWIVAPPKISQDAIQSSVTKRPFHKQDFSLKCLCQPSNEIAISAQAREIVPASTLPPFALAVWYNMIPLKEAVDV